jgi:protease IV
MSLEADAIAARRALRRKVTFWRVAALAIFSGAILALALSAGSGSSTYLDHIARIRIDGLITGDEKTLKLIEEVEAADHALAVVVRIDSPGGTTVGSEALYESLSKLAEKKPVVAVMDTVAASGGYIVALPSHRIFARGNTITGSIGVIFSWPEMSKLLDMVGVKMEEIKSGELKAAPSPYAPITPKTREVSAAMVADSFQWFTGLVAERRKLSQARVLELSDGRVYTGRQALKEGLIDELGGEEQALAWLKSAKGIQGEPEVIEYEPEGPSLREGLGVSVLRGILGWAGLGALAAPIEKALSSERLSLDGMQSVWHP